MENQETQIPMAFLVDGDNASSVLIREMLTEASRYGPILIKNVYGDWSRPQMKGWKEARLEHALNPVQQFSNVSKKNATDAALIIDAMDILHEGVVKGFCIVSSDSDFTALATRLRKSGAFVLGIGKEITHISFKNACDQFVLTEKLAGTEEPKVAEVKGKADAKVTGQAKRNKKSPEEALDLIITAYQSIEKGSSYVYMSDLGNALEEKFSPFKSSTYGKRSLKALIEALPESFAIEEEKGRTGVFFVRRQASSTASPDKKEAI